MEKERDYASKIGKISLRWFLPSTIWVFLLLLLMGWRLPTKIETDLVVERVNFTVGGTDRGLLMNSARFHSIHIQKFSRIELRPETVEVADPKEFILNVDPKESRYSDAAWKSIRLAEPLFILTGKDERLLPGVALENATLESDTALGSLDQIWADPGSEVTLEVGGVTSPKLTIRIDHGKTLAASTAQSPSAKIAIYSPFQLMVHHGKASGLGELPYQNDFVTYRILPKERNPIIEVAGQPSSLALVLSVLSNKTSDVFTENGIAVQTIKFVRLGPKGDLVTTLMEDGEILYSDHYDKKRSAQFKASDFIELGRLTEFSIEDISFDLQHRGIRLHLKGIAGDVNIVSAQFEQDCRLSIFDRLAHNPFLKLLYFGLGVIFSSIKEFSEWAAKKRGESQ